MTRWRVVGDSAELPVVTFGHRSALWWGTIGYMVIEGWTLAICAGTYLYLRNMAAVWPPAATPLPGLGMSSANVALMLVSFGPVWWTDRAARRLDKLGVRVGLTICSVLGLGFLVLRWLEFQNLNTAWQANAYGSIVWATIAFHSSLLVLQVAEVVGLTAIVFRRQVPVRFMSDTADAALYWYFIVLAWLPLYLMIYIFPRFA